MAQLDTGGFVRFDQLSELCVGETFSLFAAGGLDKKVSNVNNTQVLSPPVPRSNPGGSLALQAGSGIFLNLRLGDWRTIVNAEPKMISLWARANSGQVNHRFLVLLLSLVLLLFEAEHGDLLAFHVQTTILLFIRLLCPAAKIA